MRKLKEDTEGVMVMAGSLDTLFKPLVALVRLNEGTVMNNTLEVPVPVRFFFIVMTPTFSPNMDHHEVARSFSTLMANPVGHNTTMTANNSSTCASL